MKALLAYITIKFSLIMLLAWWARKMVRGEQSTPN